MLWLDRSCHLSVKRQASNRLSKCFQVVKRINKPRKIDEFSVEEVWRSGCAEHGNNQNLKYWGVVRRFIMKIGQKGKFITQVVPSRLAIIEVACCGYVITMKCLSLKGK